MLSNSTLLTSIPLTLDKSEYHTSVGDMSTSDIITVSNFFDEIELIDHGFDHDSPNWLETKILLNYLCHKKPVINFTQQFPKTFTCDSNFVPNAKGNNLWIFGCSHSHGIGLTSPDQRFGSLISQHLNLTPIFVTQPGSSLQWSLRHLVNSNINNNDVVVWQITTPHRLTLYNGDLTKEIILAGSKDRCLLDVFDDQQMFFHHCSLLNYGVKYLRSKNARFVMVSILDQQKLFYCYLDEYTKYPEYCYTPGSYLDLGTDSLHLGPLSNKAIAHSIINHLQCNDD